MNIATENTRNPGNFDVGGNSGNFSNQSTHKFTYIVTLSASCLSSSFVGIFGNIPLKNLTKFSAAGT
jgi:hypothetical protein